MSRAFQRKATHSRKSIRGGSARAAQSNEARWSDTQDNWGTPGVVLSPICKFNGGLPPALDPCSNPASIVCARVEWYGPHAGGTDGLLIPWLRKGLVYVNPPYSAKLPWIWKCANEAARGSEIISLTPADTDTRWFQEFGRESKEKCFWRGRLTFRGDKAHPARFPCVLLYWGRRRARFRRIFSQHGWVP